MQLADALAEVPAVGTDISIGLSYSPDDELAEESTAPLAAHPAVAQLLAEHRPDVPGVTHPMYMGIRHCGILARKLEVAR